MPGQGSKPSRRATASRTPRATKTPPPNSSLDPTTQWARDVDEGRIVAGPHIRNAARRHLDDLQHAGKRGLVFDVEAADRAIRFFPTVLRLAGGKFEAKPFNLEPSQKFKVGSLFGWRRADDGFRRFRRAYIEEAKGNGKSPWAAGVGMYCLLADGEARAEVYAAASKKDQAMVLFRDAVAMRNQSPALRERLTPSGVQPVWNLADRKTNSFFRPLASDDTQSGPRPSCALCDEVHEHKDGNVIEMLERGFKSRRQPLLIMITNSGSNLNSICWEEHVHAIRAAAGNPSLDGRAEEDTGFVGDHDAAVAYDDSFSFVCSLDADDDPLEDPTCWIKANPLLGVTMPASQIESAVRHARSMPGKLNNVLRLHFCVWTQSDTAWMSKETLDAVLDDFDPEDEFAGRDVYCGLDLSATQDLTALAFVVADGEVDMPDPEDETKTVKRQRYALWLEAFTPGDTIRERAAKDKAPYEVWAKRGFLHAPSGRQIRMDFVAARIGRASSIFALKWLAFDRYAFAKLTEQLDDNGIEVPEVEHPQGGKRRGKVPESVIAEWKEARGLEDDDDGEGEKGRPLGLWMPASLGSFETLILEKRIRIQRNPVVISAMMSAAIAGDELNNRWFSKRKATNRIDAAVASAMAVGVATSGWDEVADTGPSIYETQEIFLL